jgi:hypothetical protein
MRGQLQLIEAAQKLIAQIAAGKIGSDDADEEFRLVRNAKSVVLLSLGLAYQRFQADLEKQQEVCMRIADMVMEAFAMESALLRTRKLRRAGKETIADDICSVFLRDAMGRVELAARGVLGACSDGEVLRRNMSVLRRLAVYDPVNAVARRRNIAKRLLARERYVI